MTKAEFVELVKAKGGYESKAAAENQYGRGAQKERKSTGNGQDLYQAGSYCPEIQIRQICQRRRRKIKKGTFPEKRIGFFPLFVSVSL